MKKVGKCFCFVLSIAVAVLLMTGCRDENLEVLDYSLVPVSAADLDVLAQYPNLQTLDLSGSDCYEAIAEYISANPQVKVQYDVQIGDSRYPQDTEKLVLNDGEYDYDLLLTNLAYLPGLSELELPRTTLNPEQLSVLRENYPDLNVDYSVFLLGKDRPADTTALDLSQMSADQIDEVACQIENLPDLVRILLKDENGQSVLSPVEVKKLTDAAPGAVIDYSFELFGKTLSTTDERVEYVNVPIGDDGVQSIREALDIMPSCSYFKLDSCGIGNEAMERLRDDYPEVKVVWRVFFNETGCLTDTEMVHWNGCVGDKQLQVLKYCTDMKYLDLGHNTAMTDISFVSTMPELRIFIIVDSKVTSLEPLANCTKLEHLEIVQCKEITDISPLANCKELKRFNMSSTFGIKDLTPLHGLKKLERVYLGGDRALKEQFELLCEQLPDCWATNVGGRKGSVSGNYAVGWRLNRDLSYADWYIEMRKIFNYDKVKYGN